MIFFSHCYYCNAVIDTGEKLCRNCSARLKKAEFDSFMTRCSVCGFPLVSADYNCRNCAKHPGMKVFSVFDYRDSFARHLLELYKFNGHIKFSVLFAAVLKKYLKKDEIIIPVPSSETGLRKRGYDQIAEITEHLENAVFPCIHSMQPTDLQSKQLNRTERTEFSKKRFVMSGFPPEDSDLVILDDVYTTGSTVGAVYGLLRSSGYRKIRAVTLYMEI